MWQKAAKDAESKVKDLMTEHQNLSDELENLVYIAGKGAGKVDDSASASGSGEETEQSDAGGSGRFASVLFAGAAKAATNFEKVNALPPRQAPTR
eukprot:230202-Rhodomonas_salina.1